MHSINVLSLYTGETFGDRGFLCLTFTFTSSVVFNIFEQFHVQFCMLVEELYLNFVIFSSLLNLQNSGQITLAKNLKFDLSLSFSLS